MTDYPTANTSGPRSGRPRLIVLHSTETPTNTARAVARAFQNTSRKASAHWIVGTDGTYSGVPESHVAWAAPGANHDGIQIEQAGYAYRTDWTSGDGLAVLTATAAVVAGIHARLGIPLVHLTDAQLAAGASGVVTHAQVSRVYHRSDHTDPGPNYPMSTMLAMAAGGQAPTPAAAPAPAAVAADGQGLLAVDGSLGPATIARWQQVMGTEIDGVISQPSACVRAFQAWLNSAVAAGSIRDLTGAGALDVDGYAGPKTWRAFQFWAGNALGEELRNLTGYTLDGAHLAQWCDGSPGPLTVRALQIALNRSQAGSGRLTMRAGA